MDAAVVAAIEAGRSIIVPDAQCAAALRLAYARYQRDRGVAVWSTPEIFPWDAYLAQQLRRAAANGGRIPAQLLLSRSQERAVWEQLLDETSTAAEEGMALRAHASVMQRAAQRANQSLLQLDRSAITEEEQLLATTVARFRARCLERGWLSLRQAEAIQLEFLRGSTAPLFTGQLRLTEMQAALARRHWPDAGELLAPLPTMQSAASLCVAANLQQEWSACAAWCRTQLTEDPERRLLVISAYSEWSLPIQAAWLWREFAAGSPQQLELEPDARYLAIEGGRPLAQLGLVSDALNALQLLQAGEVDAERLSQLLLSPYLQFGAAASSAKLELALRRYEVALWPRQVLVGALQARASDNTSAAALGTWLDDCTRQLASTSRRSASAWAEALSQCLRSAGFATQRLHSGDQQRLGRWEELLDEFAALDAVAAPMTLQMALARLQLLAQQAQHQAASSDAAITLSRRLSDPVAQYAGIYVVGLSETAWPEPPRPDPFIAAEEQRKHAWPESSVTERMAHAQWSLTAWQARTTQLVLSYAAQDGDLTHRPSALLAGLASVNATAVANSRCYDSALGAVQYDEQLPPLPSASTDTALSGGLERLRLQQACAFRAQAQFRLGAEPLPRTRVGISAALRGRLLHKLFENLWRELQTQAQLAALDESARLALFARHWEQALRDCAGVSLHAVQPRILVRERLRAERLVQRVLQLEIERGPFQVEELEATLAFQTAAGTLQLRVDRLDAMPTGQRLLVDYKTGNVDTVALQDGLARPLQLAVYCLGLAQRQQAVHAALFLSLKPGKLGYVGAADGELNLPKPIKAVADWAQASQGWQAEVSALIARHIAGDATVEPSTQVCKLCHLAALCRKTDLPDEEQDETDGAVEET